MILHHKLIEHQSSPISDTSFFPTLIIQYIYFSSQLSPRKKRMTKHAAPDSLKKVLGTCDENEEAWGCIIPTSSELEPIYLFDKWHFLDDAHVKIYI